MPTRQPVVIRSLGRRVPVPKPILAHAVEIVGSRGPWLLRLLVPLTSLLLAGVSTGITAAQDTVLLAATVAASIYRAAPRVSSGSNKSGPLLPLPHPAPGHHPPALLAVVAAVTGQGSAPTSGRGNGSKPRLAVGLVAQR